MTHFLFPGGYVFSTSQTVVFDGNGFSEDKEGEPLSGSVTNNGRFQ